METATVSAETAQRLLGIRPETLYAYVSRGKIHAVERAESGAGDRRSKRYLLEDIQALLRRKTVRQAPEQAGEQVLHYGLPILKTSLSRLTESEIFIRGEPLSALAREMSFEAFCAWLWLGDRSTGASLFAEVPYPQVHRVEQPLDALQAALPGLEAAHRGDRSVPAVGVEIIKYAAILMTGGRKTPPAERPLAAVLAKSAQDQGLFNAMLILAAEHELNASAFTARCVASTGASPYAAVNAGLCALRGPRHGGATLEVEALLARIAETGEPGAVVSAYLKRGDSVPGFGHRVYRGTDPRAAVLLDLLERSPQRGRSELRLVRQLIHAMDLATGLAPNLDLALAVCMWILRAPPGAALRLFCLARIAGFIAHAIEQYEDGRLLRPRAAFEA